MGVKIEIVGDKCWLSSPYHPDLPAGAKDLGGRWSSREKEWYFDPRDEKRVRDLARSVYGTDGSAAAESDHVTVVLAATTEHRRRHGGIYFAGRCLCHATGRDSGARLEDGVVKLSGSIDSGGSVKNWCTFVADGTVLELRDVPRAAVEAATTPNCGWNVAYLDAPEEPAPLDREALLAEAQALRERLAFIEALLSLDQVLSVH